LKGSARTDVGKLDLPTFTIVKFYSSCFIKSIGFDVLIA
jgi:hypothetical protein